MLGVDNNFYTWKDGCMYQHNSNATRNAFYKDWDTLNNPYFTYNSTITTVFNQDPTSNKMFKTISLDSNKAWDVTVTTDLSTGTIADTYFKEKEGGWFAFIRRADDGSYDTYSMSTQGIGSVTSYNAGTKTLTFTFNINNSIATGDKLYKVNGSNTLTLLGEVASHTATTVTLVSATLATISAADVIVFVKNAMAESYGARGYYMEVTATSDSSTEVEIFSISSSVHKSNP
jgi:hypothetical protein